MNFDLIHFLGLALSIAGVAAGALLCLKAAADGQTSTQFAKTRFFTFD